jgi:hypothetical protein
MDIHNDVFPLETSFHHISAKITWRAPALVLWWRGDSQAHNSQPFHSQVFLTSLSVTGFSFYIQPDCDYVNRIGQIPSGSRDLNGAQLRECKASGFPDCAFRAPCSVYVLSYHSLYYYYMQNVCIPFPLSGSHHACENSCPFRVAEVGTRLRLISWSVCATEKIAS